MKFSFYNSVRAQQGELCTYEKFLDVTHSHHVASICSAIASETDHERQQTLKKQLPIITPHASFDGARKNNSARPSGIFMLDVDKVDDPFRLWSSIIAQKDHLGILLAHKTPSTHGLRLLCKCRKEFSTLDECQQWLAEQIGVAHDEACKDWARSSYIVPYDYIYYLDAKSLFMNDPEVVYEVKTESDSASVRPGPVASPSAAAAPASPRQTTYRGLKLSDIAHRWLLMNGGEPVEGERNDRLHRLACVMRGITDYNEEVLIEALPHYGLGDDEVRRFVHSACIAPPTYGIPKSLHKVLQKMLAEQEGKSNDDMLADLDMELVHDALPPLPPMMRELVNSAPDDFKKALILCLLPLLGTLGSKLRAEYLDGKMHSPSFLVSLEAPQASGKSFMMDMAKLLLAPIEARDAFALATEEGYIEKAAEVKMTDKKKSIGPRPKVTVRILVPATSNAMLLSRLKNSQGLHLVCVAPEIDSVYKANKQSFSNYNDLLRMAFDNDTHGQDYYSPDTVSGKAAVYLNTLYSGTPKQMRRFYPDVESGLVSRVLFVTLPDQFGKPMPVWRQLSAKEMAVVERQRSRLDAVSVLDDVVQPDHVMQLSFLKEALRDWNERNRQEAVRTGDRTRDTFYRRSAVVGFRAGMLAWFLYGERNTPKLRKDTIAFAQWVADQMLTQHMLRFEIDGRGSNTNKWEEAYSMLGNEFTLEEMQQSLIVTGCTTKLKQVLYKWHLSGCIEDIETSTAANGKVHPIRFRKK